MECVIATVSRVQGQSRRCEMASAKRGGPRARGKESESRLFANAPTYKRWLNMNIRCAAKMAAFPVSGARPTGAVTRERDPTWEDVRGRG